jgi:Arc/MetJ family transcription regulator
LLSVDDIATVGGVVRTVLDIDDEAMRLAAEELGTTTKVATVNAALRRIAEQRTSRLMMADLLSMDLDLDEETMRSAWRS